ncbi:unnamed protein product [Rotaria magnacalcarata]|uniref:Antifreeze protein n=1 Tax=Rotaria magnacalcarata TaxID=392030 RepID=A0A816V4I2_9BILA|nr:unnamed protein product [Rotaria magnacalcarata]CAF2132070.1 unnamed protein product [Rotaria magnacalcarata]CAF3989041.1 unnamed protein product [Rotaria magnacalcarata]CAF4114386.1 unnamed protein product [Rotaria magnacalcarata]
MLRSLNAFSMAVFIATAIKGQNLTDFGTTSCGCCPSPSCQASSVPCSANSNCECLFMTITTGGMCADTVISCQNLISCENDNMTCSVPNTICVNNTRCARPVCFPIQRASFQTCPPLNARISSTTAIPMNTTILVGNSTIKGITATATTTVTATMSTAKITTATVSTTKITTTTVTTSNILGK